MDNANELVNFILLVISFAIIYFGSIDACCCVVWSLEYCPLIWNFWYYIFFLKKLIKEITTPTPSPKIFTCQQSTLRALLFNAWLLLGITYTRNHNIMTSIPFDIGHLGRRKSDVNYWVLISLLIQHLDNLKYL